MADTELAVALLRPDAYPWRPATVEMIETHVSWVFLAGEFVLKVKRPVTYGFVDHASAASRRRSCHDEVRLNRRLTDGVYLGVVPIRRDGDRLRVNGPGAPIEWGTLMRRLPAERMLDVLLRTDTAPADIAARLAHRLVPFHRDIALPCDGPPDAVATAATRIVTENLDEIEPFAGSPLGPLQTRLVAGAMRRFALGHADLLAKRATTGWIREGHGDLRAEHVCLEPDGAVQIFDCVEFNRALRCADVASDLAFLLMDLARLGAGTVAADLLARYRAAGFDLPEDLLRWYRAHRALVRAKVACLRWSAAPDGAAPGLDAKAVDYLNVATAAALPAAPVLIAMTGLSGTGKSTVAAAIGRALGVAPIASDVIRKTLAGVDGAAPAAWEAGLYTREWSAATYQLLLERARTALAAGAPVILDAAFLSWAARERLAALGRTARVPTLLVETTCEEGVALDRIVARAARGGSPSDATVEVYRRQWAAVADTPPPVPAGVVHIVLDTSAAGPVCLDPVLAALDRARVLATTAPASTRSD